MKKKSIIIAIFSSIATLTGILIFIGFLFQKTDDEKMNGLTNLFDVSSKGMIAYVNYDEGEHQIILKSGQEEQLALKVNKEKNILDLAFSPDGSSLVYSIGNKDVEDELLTTVNTLDVETFKEKNLFTKSGMITEVAFDPNDGNKLFYLKANTYENYSPIARANPHEFDIYSYSVKDEKHTQITNLDKYGMSSLQVSAIEEAVYVQMFDDADADTAEDLFATNQRIFKIVLEKPDQLTVISDQTKEIDIYDFVMLPDEEKIIYQSISNFQSGETFQYELFEYNLNIEEEKQLTNLKEHTSRPELSSTGDEIYFIVDLQFAQKQPEFHLYKLNLQTDEITEVKLNYTSIK